MSKQNQPLHKQPLVWAIVIAVVIIAGWLIYLRLNKPTSSHSSTTNTQSTPTPSPGTPGNPGDTAKSTLYSPSPSVAASSKPTPTPTTSAQPLSVVIDGVVPSATDQNGVRISNQVVGASIGDTCQAALHGPGGSQASGSGTVISAGTYNLCSLGTITGVSTPGSWSAVITVSSNGQTSSSNTYAFTR